MSNPAWSPPAPEFITSATDVRSLTALGAAGTAGETQSPNAEDDADAVNESAARSTPRTRRRFALRLPREARVGIAVSLSFGLLATVMIFNHGSKEKTPTAKEGTPPTKGKTPPNLEVPHVANGSAPKPADGNSQAGTADSPKPPPKSAKPDAGQLAANDASEPASANNESPMAAPEAPKADGPEKPAMLPPAADPTGVPAPVSQPDAKPSDALALPLNEEAVLAPKPVEPTASAAGSKPPASEPSDGHPAPAPVVDAPSAGHAEVPPTGSVPPPADRPAAIPSPDEKTPPAAVPLPSAADPSSGTPAPSPVEPGPSAANAPAGSEASTPLVTTLPTAAPDPSPAATAAPSAPNVTPPPADAVAGGSGPGPAPQAETREAALPAAPTVAGPATAVLPAPEPRAQLPSASPPAPAEMAVVPSSVNPSGAASQESWVKLPNARFTRGSDALPQAPTSRAAGSADAAAESAGPELADKIEPIPHVVQPGENFWTISRLYYRSGRYYRALWAANRDKVPVIEELVVGTTIRIPPQEELDPALILPPAPRADPRASRATVPLRRSSLPVASEGSRATSPAKRADVEETLTLPTRDVVDEPPARRRPVDEGVDEAPAEEPDRRRRPRYKVRSRYETIRSIAKATLGDAHREDEILRLNRKVIDDPNHLTPGQYIELPEDALIGGTSR